MGILDELFGAGATDVMIGNKQEVITIEKLIADGHYEWSKTVPDDPQGRSYLQRTEKGALAAMHWSPEKLHAVAELLAHSGAR